MRRTFGINDGKHEIPSSDPKAFGRPNNKMKIWRKTGIFDLKNPYLLSIPNAILRAAPHWKRYWEAAKAQIIWLISISYERKFDKIVKNVLVITVKSAQKYVMTLEPLKLFVHKAL